MGAQLVTHVVCPGGHRVPGNRGGNSARQPAEPTHAGDKLRQAVDRAAGQKYPVSALGGESLHTWTATSQRQRQRARTPLETCTADDELARMVHSFAAPERLDNVDAFAEGRGGSARRQAQRFENATAAGAQAGDDAPGRQLREGGKCRGNGNRMPAVGIGHRANEQNAPGALGKRGERDEEVAVGAFVGNEHGSGTEGFGGGSQLRQLGRRPNGVQPDAPVRASRRHADAQLRPATARICQDADR